MTAGSQTDFQCVYCAPPFPTKRKDLGRWLKAKGYLKGAEIGVEQGKFAEVLCQAGLELLCVDPWMAQPDYRTHVDQAKWDWLMRQALKRLDPYAHLVSFVRATSVEAAQDVRDGSLSFVYLDGRHDEEHVRQDIAAWRPKVEAGGCLAGHDFQLSGVRAAVLAAFGAPMHVTSGDRSPSWMVTV